MTGIGSLSSCTREGIQLSIVLCSLVCLITLLIMPGVCSFNSNSNKQILGTYKYLRTKN